MNKHTSHILLVSIILALTLVLIPSDILASSQRNVTKNYLMVFHACDTTGGADCHDPRNHQVYLAQSDDGAEWDLAPGWEPFPGSVPDVIRRGDTLYIYTPDQLVRYHLEDSSIEPPVKVKISGLDNGFVDPSLTLDEDGHLVLFFLYGQPGMDPAGCAADEESCLRQIGSATEVDGSDGEQFTLDEGQRVAMTIKSSSQVKSFSDPDIFFDGDQYVLYISHGAWVSVWVSKELHGDFVIEPSLPQSMLTMGEGGVPAGHFDPISEQYWTFVHTDQAGQTIIRRATHANFQQNLSDYSFKTVLTGENVRLGKNYSVASPGFAVNEPGYARESAGQKNPPQDGSAEQHIPEFNPFEEMTTEQEACLREAWGEQVFDEITNFKRPPTFEEETVLQECLGDAFRPPGEHGELGPGGQNGGHNPFTDQTYYATSADGLTWNDGILLADKASVPDVMRTSDGMLWAYWVDFTHMTGPNMERIGIAHSMDNGANWERLGNANFTGLGDIVPVDPDAFELPDGRIRLYFYDITVRQLEHPIYSAISVDGINFTLEEGVRLMMDEIYDPDVIQLPDGSYRMYVNAMDILSASSSDGLAFTPDEGVRVSNGAVPGSIVMPDGSIRMYNCAGGISAYESQDGLNFTLLQQGVIRDTSGEGQILCDPSVTAIEGGYLIVYKVNPGNKP